MEPRPEVYRPYGVNPLGAPILVIRTKSDPLPMVRELSAKVRAVLEAEIEAGSGRFRGVRYGTSHDDSVVGKHVSRPIPPHRLLDPKFREGFAELGKLGLTFDSWHFHPQLPDLVDLARAFPGTTIIVDHVGGVLGVGPYAGRSAEILPAWRKSVAALAQCPNVNVKLGGLGMTSFGFGFHERDTPPSSKTTSSRPTSAASGPPPAVRSLTAGMPQPRCSSDTGAATCSSTAPQRSTR